MNTINTIKENRILIIGGGPVGCTLALILAKYGVASLILESREAPTPMDESRAIVWMPRGMEFLQWAGLLDRFLANGLKRTLHQFRHNGSKLLDLSFDRLQTPYPFSLQMPQHVTETLLEQAALQTGKVEIRRNDRLLEINDRQEAVIESADGRYAIDAPWAVGCDGARSTVRKALGISTSWKDYGTYSAVADFEAELDFPKDQSSIYLHTDRPYGFFYFAPGRWRFIYRLNAGEDRDRMTSEEEAAALFLSKAPHAKIKRFLWASSFRLGQGQSETYRKGKWLLAGDAAHAMGPSAGAGMMIGILGAWRLGWRLAQAYSQSPITDGLLDDYIREQREAANEIQHTNAMIFKNMSMVNPIAGFVRTTALRLLARNPKLPEGMTEKEALLAQRLPVQSAADYVQEGPWKLAERHCAWETGKRAPHAAGINGQSALDLIGSRHVLVSIGKKQDERAERAAEAAVRSALKVPLENGVLQAPSELAAGASGRTVLALVRPDQHIAAIYVLNSH